MARQELSPIPHLWESVRLPAKGKPEMVRPGFYADGRLCVNLKCEPQKVCFRRVTGCHT